MVTTSAALQGIFRRRMHAVAQPGFVSARVEDDYHHMEVEVSHDGAVVTGLAGRMIRRPWTSCRAAADRLPDLVGLPLSARCWILPPDFAAKQHCTHLLDTALLAIAQAARGGERRYEFRVPNRIEGATAPSALRDGQEILHLQIQGDDILAPPPFAGQNMRRILPWAAATLDDDMLEALYIVRRVLLVSQGAGYPPRERFNMRDVYPRMAGACHTFQPAYSETAEPEDSNHAVSDRPELFSLPAAD